MDNRQVKTITEEFNKKFGFKNEKVVFKMVCAELQNFVPKPQLRPNTPGVFWSNFPYYEMKDNGDIYLVKSSQIDTNDNYKKVNSFDIMNQEEWTKFTNGLEYYENNIKNIKEYKRPSWDEYFIEIANTVSKRATCNRGRSGCVVVRDRQILVTGYVGSPVGLPHCDDVGHQFKRTIHEDGHITNHCVRTVHAEQNAICQAAKLGISLDGSTLYCRMTPCRTCAMLIINCGIKRVVCEKRYHTAEESEEMFKQAGIQLEYFSEETLKYDNQ